MSREEGEGEVQVWGHRPSRSPDMSRDLNRHPVPLYRHMSCCSWECNQTLGHLEQRNSATQHGELIIERAADAAMVNINSHKGSSRDIFLQKYTKVLQNDLPVNIGMIGKGVCPLLISNMYWIQLVALQSLASFPHSSDKAFMLLDGAWTSSQALYMAEKVQFDYFLGKTQNFH